jgi:hypothetical protein
MKNSVFWDVTPYRARLRYGPKRLMRSIDLRRWYININIAVLDIIHLPVFYLNRTLSETEFYYCLQVEPTQLGTADKVTLSLSPDRTIDKVQHCDCYISITLS